MYACNDFHDHTKPAGAVEDGVWGVVGRCQGLAEAIHGVKSHLGFVVVRDGLRSEGVCDAEGRDMVIFGQGYEQVVWVRKDSRNMDGREGKTFVHGDRRRRGE